MGLDTTHNAWHGPYSSFNNFRMWLGKRIGIDLNDAIGYGGNKFHEQDIKHPLMPLFNHSDCDGELTPEECKSIADGLDLVINATVPDENPFSPYQKAIQFRDGCLAAFKANETLEFH